MRFLSEGYRDGHDLETPEPSDNRSACYRHSFWIGRKEKLNGYAGRADVLRQAADAAVAEDAGGSASV